MPIAPGAFYPFIVNTDPGEPAQAKRSHRGRQPGSAATRSLALRERRKLPAKTLDGWTVARSNEIAPADCVSLYPGRAERPGG